VAIAAALGCGGAVFFAIVIVTVLTSVGPVQQFSTPVAAAAKTSAPVSTADIRRPAVIGHRGASAYRPEHTLAGYDLAIRLGADYIEADLVPTRDGVLVARHENELSQTTDVSRHPEFANRRRTARIEGQPFAGWFAEDFTLAELKTLRAVERDPRRRPASATYDGLYQVPTLQEMIDLARTDSARFHRTIGLYLETKTPAYFTAIHLAPEPILAATLHHNHLDHAGAPVFLESFEAASLRLLRALVRVPLIQLISGPADQRTSPAALDAARAHADGIGVERVRLASDLAGRSPALGTGLVAVAHRLGLVVHVYTFADDTVPAALPPGYTRSSDLPTLAAPLAEYRAYFALGVDGVFSDNPEVAAQARASLPTPTTELRPTGPAKTNGPASTNGATRTERPAPRLGLAS
jgi:glycerophosphoryl diester phosphodiesterase